MLLQCNMKVQNLATVIHIHVFLSKQGIWETVTGTEHPYYHLKREDGRERESFPNQLSCRNQSQKILLKFDLVLGFICFFGVFIGDFFFRGRGLFGVFGLLLFWFGFFVVLVVCCCCFFFNPAFYHSNYFSCFPLL